MINIYNLKIYIKTYNIIDNKFYNQQLNTHKKNVLIKIEEQEIYIYIFSFEGEDFRKTAINYL